MAAFAAVLGWLWRVAYLRETERSGRIESARASLERALRDQIVPAMQAAAVAQHESFKVVSELYRRQADQLKNATAEGAGHDGR